METTYTNCNRCPNGCPLGQLKCGRGRKYLEELHAQGLALEYQESSGGKEYDGHGHGEHGHGGHEHGEHRHGGHEHGEHRHGGHGHGEHGHGDCEHGEYEHEKHDCGGHDHEKCGGKGKGSRCFEQDQDELYGLMRACGHYLYHKADNNSCQKRIMRILGKQKEVNQKELLEILNIQPGSLSEILIKMENKGLLERSKDEEDRRRSIVRITEKGEAHEKELLESDAKKDLFAVLNEEQKEELKALLKLVLDSWHEGLA